MWWEVSGRTTTVLLRICLKQHTLSLCSSLGLKCWYFCRFSVFFNFLLLSDEMVFGVDIGIGKLGSNFPHVCFSWKRHEPFSFGTGYDWAILPRLAIILQEKYSDIKTRRLSHQGSPWDETNIKLNRLFFLGQYRWGLKRGDYLYRPLPIIHIYLAKICTQIRRRFVSRDERVAPKKVWMVKRQSFAKNPVEF